MALLPRLVRPFLAILMLLALAGVPLRDLPCPEADGAGHHHHHGHHPADCACCCDCLGSVALALPESGVGPARIVVTAAYRSVESTLPGRAPQPEPDPPRPLTQI